MSALATTRSGPGFELYAARAEAVLESLPSGSVNLIAIDPPYFKVKDEPWDRQWDKPAQFLAWLGDEVLERCRRVLAPNGSLYCCASPQMAWGVEGEVRSRFSVLTNIRWAKPPFATKAEMFDKSILRAPFPASETIIFAEQIGSDSMAMGESGYEAECERLRGFVFEPLRAYICGEFERAGMLTTEGKIAANVACGFSASSGGMAARHYFSRSQWWLPTPEHHDALRGLLGAGYLERPWADLRREFEDLRRPFTVSAKVPYTDVWTFPTVAKYPGKHPCEKPLAMMRHIVAASSRPGDTVADFFLGSGSTGRAALGLGRKFIGCDMSAHWVNHAAESFAGIGFDLDATRRGNETAPTGGQLALI